ncbi:hypothetical protein J5X98_00785 [Leptothermofonsia sichuanensis E412]|uniref:hypothetical protein n=1 Tax=Leptothermofonsia sichuanensis TaxID=2917832 RepID=UPI001CA74EF5|nr:hypothetical protein [Leptothermofonsia sichuanensis]QZZ21082.1 hypothetical protein J5X98_00785 [Leptothermofonsia sichuanensis E412]
MLKNPLRPLALATVMALTPLNIAVLNTEVHASPLPRSLTSSNPSKRTGIPIAQRSAGSLPNGTNLTSPQNAQGRGTLKVINGTGYDAIIKLVDQASGRTQRFVYIQANREVTLKQIGSCRCTLKFSIGTNWNPNTQRFSQSRLYSQFRESLNFREIRTPSGIRWMNYTATLHPVKGGTARTLPINERDF